MKIRCFVVVLFGIMFGSLFANVKHPCLLLTKEGVTKIKQHRGKLAVFDRTVDRVILDAEKAIALGIVVPQPLDNGGGYSHEKHKDNYYAMYYAGIAYQITGMEKYAIFVRDMLREYAKMIPQLGPHPCNSPDKAGRLFFQPLNDCVWSCFTSMAYDYVYNWLSADERELFEQNIFRPMAEFISNGNKYNQEVFDKMHNHGTWANVAVGMIGHVIGEDSYVDMSLYGLHKDKKGGYLKQLDVLFSPDGYYMEGAYYQRYALWPFVVYAQVLEYNHPEMHISSYRDGIFNKATRALINMSYNTELFRINDAVYQTLASFDVVNSVDASFLFNNNEKDLLSIALLQDNFIISDGGLETALAIANNEVKPFEFKSCFLRDGADGKQGGLGIIRNGNNDKQTALLFKATAHGQSHGHYDKLSILLNDNGNEILQDYGSVRYLNLEPRDGGRYTKENKSWALQTISHNTVTVDEKSHFNGDFKLSSKHSSLVNYYDFSNPDCQVMSAVENNAAPGVSMNRTVAMIKLSDSYPLIVDIFKIKSNEKHQYDLPYYYVGTLSSSNFGMERYNTQLPVLGEKNGYQHLWVEGKTSPKSKLAELTWFNKNRFYSLNTLVDPEMELLLVRMGANDPKMNIRNDPGYILRKSNADNYTFVSTLDIHGEYNLVTELTSQFKTTVKDIELLLDNDQFTAVRITKENGKKLMFVTLNTSFNTEENHEIVIEGQKYSWKGNYHLFMN